MEVEFQMRKGVHASIYMKGQEMNQLLINAINVLSEDINLCAVRHGFWDGNYGDGMKIALMHCELSEALEGLRHDNPKDEHCPEFGNVEIELADCIIRILDFCNHKKYNIGEAMSAKMAYNETRPYKHGKKF